jgi:hypothetical protein
MANLLLCLGMCFFVGGIKRHEQTFHEAVSEVGTWDQQTETRDKEQSSANFADSLVEGLLMTFDTVVETTLGAVVELVLFMVLLYNHGRTEHSDLIPVIQASPPAKPSRFAEGTMAM